MDSQESPNTSFSARTRYLPCLLVVVGIGVYANSLSGPFIFDDSALIIANEDIRQLWPPCWAMPRAPGSSAINARPVVGFTFAINYAIGGLNVRGFHVGNIAVHILCALVLFGIVRRTLLGPKLVERFGRTADGLAFAGALLWLVHPLQTQCVNYIEQRTESIMGLFYLLTLYCTIRGIESSRRGWHAAAVFSCALGMASKEVMVTAPLMVLLYDRIFAAASLRQVLRQRWGLYLGLALTWIVLALLMMSLPHGDTVGFSSHVTPWNYALNQCIVIVDYLRKSFWPRPLLLDYGFPQPLTVMEVVPYSLLLGTLLMLTAAGLFYRPMLGFLGAWFFIILGPTSSFVPIVNEAGAERRVYLPLAGLIVLLVIAGYVALERASGRFGAGGQRRVSWIGGALLLVVATPLTYATVQRNQEYRSAVSIWQTAVEALPLNPRAHVNLGMALAAEGRYDEAIHRYRRTLEILPDMVQAHYHLANALRARGEYETAVAHYRRVLQTRPGADVHTGLGIALATWGQFEEAIRHFRRALQIRPDLWAAHFHLGAALGSRGDYEGAIRHYRRALQLQPDHVDAHVNLGAALGSRGDYEGAIRHYRRALQLQPDHPRAHNNLGAILGALGDYETAIYHYRQVLKSKPDYLEARRNLNLAIRLQREQRDGVRE